MVIGNWLKWQSVAGAQSSSEVGMGRGIPDYESGGVSRAPSAGCGAAQGTKTNLAYFKRRKTFLVEG